MVQSPRQPAMSRTKLRSSCAPCGVCTTSGWNCTRVEAARLVGDHREGRVRRRSPSVSKPVRQPRDPVAVAHPDRIVLAHVPDALEQRALGQRSRPRRGRTRRDGRPRPRRRAAPPWSAGRSRCRAPARRRRRIPAARAGEASVVTDAGPPERITPLGFISRKASLGLLERHDLANRPPPPAPAAR